jgi:hypothetical protein
VPGCVPAVVRLRTGCPEVVRVVHVYSLVGATHAEMATWT